MTTYLHTATVTKLREYSRSYGSPEQIEYPLIVERDNSIDCYNGFGALVRTFKKGTKLLISFEGKETTERGFKIRLGKLEKAWRKRKAELEVERQNEINERMRLSDLVDEAFDDPKLVKKFEDYISRKYADVAITNKVANRIAWKKQGWVELPNGDVPHTTDVRGHVLKIARRIQGTQKAIDNLNK